MRTEHVVQTLTRWIEHDQWPSSGRLPSIRELAPRVGASPPTLRKSLALMQERGVLASLPGGNRYFVKGFAPGTREVSTHHHGGTRHERIALVLRDRLVDGVYGSGMALPSLKELRAELACSHATIRRALALVESRWGMVREERGRYVAAPGHAVGRGGSSVYFAGAPALLGSYRDHFFGLVNHLERRLREIGWGRLEWFLADNPERADAPPDHRVSAYIHLIHGPTRGWGTFFGTKRGIPVVYIDLDEIDRGRFRRHRLFVKIRPDSVKAGIVVARHLQDLGHRRAAFLSHLPLEEHCWLRNRRAGLIEVMGEPAGNPDRGIIDFVAASGEDLEVDDAGDGGAARHIGALRSILHGRGHLSARVLGLKLKGVYDLEYYHSLAARMRPLFERALAETGATAWVCANDDLALVAGAFLERNGRSVPKHISVAGFDNSPVSFADGLTSYDPAIDRIAAAAVHAISSPRAVDKDIRNIVTVSGQLVIRGSTGPAPAQANLQGTVSPHSLW